MKERPILFSAPMVRALLAGAKTQTRRICKPQPSQVLGNGRRIYADKDFKKSWAHLPGMTESLDPYVDCPYGAPGDRLWVRETFCRPFRPMRPDSTGAAAGFMYRADDDGVQINPGSLDGQWKPSIHMPRIASRITLEITGVRVERLQGISDSDANAEGVEIDGGYFKDYTRDEFRLSTARGSYHSLWQSINGPGSWDANPWVWVIEFRRLSAPTSTLGGGR